MIPTTDKFQKTILGSHRISLEFEASYNGILSTLDLNVVDGDVTISSDLIRRSATITIVDPTGELTPSTPTDIIMPLGTEMTFFRGVKYPDGTAEHIRLGVFGVDDVQIEDSGANLTIRIDLFDRSKKVQRAQFTKDYSIPKNTNLITAITRLLKDGFPTIQTNFPASDHKTSAIVYQHNTDRWKAAVDLAASIGYDLHFNSRGVCVMTQPIIQSAPVLTFTDGIDGSVLDVAASLLEIRKRYNRDKMYSHVIVTGESTGNTVPVRAEAVDDDPKSPTYWKGPFGDVPYFFTSKLITTVDQAQDAAINLLATVSGILEGLEFAALPNVALDVGDMVYVKRQKSKVDAIYAVEKITLPLTQDRNMFVTCRTRSLNVIGLVQ